MRKLITIVEIGLVGWLFSFPAYAYIDPGTGTIILQMLLGGVAGALLIAKLYYHSIMAKVRILMGKEEPPSDPDE